MLRVRVTGKALPDPEPEITEAPDRADLVAAFVVLDHAFADALDIGGIIVEVADQRPHGIERMIKDGAVVGLAHGRLRKENLVRDGGGTCPGYRATRRDRPPDFRSRNRYGMTGTRPSPATAGRCKPRPMIASKPASPDIAALAKDLRASAARAITL